MDLRPRLARRGLREAARPYAWRDRQRDRAPLRFGQPELRKVALGGVGEAHLPSVGEVCEQLTCENLGDGADAHDRASTGATPEPGVVSPNPRTTASGPARPRGEARSLVVQPHRRPGQAHSVP